MFLFGKKRNAPAQATQTAQTGQTKKSMLTTRKQAAPAVTETEEEKAARRQAEKEAAIAAYKEKRQLTLRRFFEIAELKRLRITRSAILPQTRAA